MLLTTGMRARCIVICVDYGPAFEYDIMQSVSCDDKTVFRSVLCEYGMRSPVRSQIYKYLSQPAFNWEPERAGNPAASVGGWPGWFVIKWRWSLALLLSQNLSRPLSYSTPPPAARISHARLPFRDLLLFGLAVHPWRLISLIRPASRVNMRSMW
jgi:hypothetical protein